MSVNRIGSWCYRHGCHLGGGALCGELGGSGRRWGSGYLPSGEGILRALGLCKRNQHPLKAVALGRIRNITCCLSLGDDQAGNLRESLPTGSVFTRLFLYRTNTIQRDINIGPCIYI